MVDDLGENAGSGVQSGAGVAEQKEAPAPSSDNLLGETRVPV